MDRPDTFSEICYSKIKLVYSEIHHCTPVFSVYLIAPYAMPSPRDIPLAAASSLTVTIWKPLAFSAGTIISTASAVGREYHA